MSESRAMRLAADAKKSLPKRIGFTVAGLAALTCPEGRDRLYVYDSKCPGLAYCVTRTGHRAYYYVCKHAGATKRVWLGGNGLTIDQARKLAAKATGQRADGIDPSEARRSLRESTTLQELWDKYRDEHLTPRCSEKTIICDKSRFNTCLAEWASRRVLTITDVHVRDLHSKLAKERGKTTANRTVQFLHRLFAFGRLARNPASKAVTMFRERSRDRFVQPAELPKFFEALDDAKTNPAMRDVFYLALFTGARRSNILAMRDEEIDIEGGTWTIPALKSKSGEVVKLPLSPQALAIIKRRMGHSSGWIFPSHGQTGHLVEIKGAWKDVRERAGLVDIRVHDLRRTLGSFQAAGGASLQIIGASLGHRSTAATAIYSRLHLDPVRESVNAAATAITMAAKAKPQAKQKTAKKRVK